MRLPNADGVKDRAGGARKRDSNTI